MNRKMLSWAVHLDSTATKTRDLPNFKEGGVWFNMRPSQRYELMHCIDGHRLMGADERWLI